MGMIIGHESINGSEVPLLLQESKSGGWSVVPYQVVSCTKDIP